MSKDCTPGPWYSANTGNHQGLVISEKDGANVAVSYAKADAPLIAAAPELLEACSIALEKLETTGETPSIAAQLRAAICKAGGDQ